MHTKASREGKKIQPYVIKWINLFCLFREKRKKKILFEIGHLAILRTVLMNGSQRWSSGFVCVCVCVRITSIENGMVILMMFIFFFVLWNKQNHNFTNLVWINKRIWWDSTGYARSWHIMSVYRFVLWIRFNQKNCFMWDMMSDINNNSL